MTTPDLTNLISTDIPNMALLLTEKGADATSTSTSGTGEDNLTSITITAGDLNTTGCLRIFVSGDMTGQNDRKTVRFYLGSTLWSLFETSIPGKWNGYIDIMSVSATSQRVMFHVVTSCFGKNPEYTKQYGDYFTATEDTSTNTIIKCTGECLNANDQITQTMMLVRQVTVG